MRVIGVDGSGNTRVLTIVEVGPKDSTPGAEHFFVVRLTDLDGNVHDGIDDPVAGPLRHHEALEAVARVAAEIDLVAPRAP